MAGRRLSAEEAALWARVMASVQPLAGRMGETPVVPPAPVPAPVARRQADPPAKPANARIARSRRPPADTLDGGWDKRLSRGLVSPDDSIDLHGHTLASAHAALDRGLARAIARGDRLLLLVTGKPPRAEAERPFARGAIRAAVGDWLAASPYHERIAAVRGAHPRHGGQGALYIVLRRARPDGSG
ncbi:Smr/MutS family protein [Sphingomonas sp.]